MKIKLVLYNNGTNKSQFRLCSGIRPWGILLAISKGSFRLTLPKLNQSFIINPYEIAYVPPNTEFYREVIEPIDFYQFTYQLYEHDERFNLPAGKLNIPKQHVKTNLDSAEIISFFPAETDDLAKQVLSKILIDNYLFSHTIPSTQLSKETLIAKNYIIEHLSEPLSVSMLAKKVHLSHNGLIWKFKKELNVTPVDYISMCRIKHAKHLLFNTDLTITEIAESCGYANAYYFSNAFKKSEGISPSKFRQKCVKS